MADEAVATETAAPEVAAPAAEPEKYEPGKRSFHAVVQAHAARIDAEKSEPAADGTETAAKMDPKVAPKTGERPPPNRLPGQRKAFFEAKAARAEAEKATQQAQTSEQRLAALEKEVQDARSGQDKVRELFDKGKFDDALKLINARGVDSFEALQRRVLAEMQDTPVNDPRMDELKQELDALKAEREEEKRARAEAEEQDRERAQTDSLYQAVCEATKNAEDPEVRRLSVVPGFNEQILGAVTQYPNASEEQIFGVVAKGFQELETSFLKSRGFTDAQIQAIITGNVPGDVKTEAKAAPPARPSAKVETAKADQPSRHKPTVTISTNAAESTHAARKWDPKSRNEAWEAAKRSHVPQR